MIELFTADTPNGKKISIMLEEIGYDYKVTKVDISEDDQFKPEFINRIDEVITFKPLEKKDLKAIVKLQLSEIIKQLDQLKNITIDFTDEAVSMLAQESFDPIFGARPVKRIIQRRVINELSKMLLRDEINKDSVILGDAVDGVIFFKNLTVESHVD